MALRNQILGAIFISILFVSCSGPEPQKPKDQGKDSLKSAQTKLTPKPEDFGDVFIDSSIGDASNLIPYLASDSASAAVTDMVFGQLLTLDKDQNLIPEMAESWDVSPDQKSITFHLKKNVKWHDGTLWTAHDVKYQFDMMIHPDLPSGYKEDFMQAEKAEVVDDYTFRITFKEPYAPALVRMAGLGGLPRHLLKGVKPADIVKSPLARTPVGNGAWKFAEWKGQTHITLESNPDHFNGRPLIAKSITRIIPDPATQFLELKSGGVDMMGLQPLQYLKQTDSAFFKDNYQKYKYLASAYTYLGYNLKRPMFQDKRVRQAICYAIDKKELIDGVLMGLGLEATGPYKPGTWAHNPDVKGCSYNPTRAMELLREAGWVNLGPDGMLLKDGKPLQFEIITNHGNPLRAKTAEIIQQRLKFVGIGVKIRVVEWSSFINNFINKRDFDACILGWTIGIDPDQYSIWHSSKTGEHELNFVSYDNKEVDSIMETARKTFDQEARKKLYYRFQQILADDQPYTFLYAPEALPIVAKRIRGIEPGAAGISYNFNKWWVPKADHKRPVMTQ